MLSISIYPCWFMHIYVIVSSDYNSHRLEAISASLFRWRCGSVPWASPMWYACGAGAIRLWRHPRSWTAWKTAFTTTWPREKKMKNISLECWRHFCLKMCLRPLAGRSWIMFCFDATFHDVSSSKCCSELRAKNHRIARGLSTETGWLGRLLEVILM